MSQAMSDENRAWLAAYAAALGLADEHKPQEKVDMRAPATGGSFQLAPAGSHIGHLMRIIDLGTQYNETYGKHQHKVCFVWELTNTKMEPKDDGTVWPFSVTEWMTLSMNEKANLRKRIEGWRNKAFASDEEAEEFDIEKLLGKPALISIIHAARKDGSTRESVSSVIWPPEGMPIPDMVNKALLLDLANFDKEAFESLGEKMQAYIKQSQEYQQLFGETADGQPVFQDAGAAASTTYAAEQQTDAQTAQPAGDDDFNDDIPF